MSRVLVIGLDACDPDIAMHLVDTGRMPVLGDLVTQGGHADVALPDGLFVGVVWPVYTRGVCPAATGRHSWIDVDPRTYELTVPDKRRLGGTTVWDALALEGHRSILFDVPHDWAEPSDRVTRVVEWGAHDHHVGFETWPPNLGTRLVDQFGQHDLLGHYPEGGGMLYAPDDYLDRAGPLRTTAEDLALARRVRPGIEKKADAASWLLREHPWHLAVVGFGESHAVGHQLWHVHDVTHARHDPMGRVFGSPIESTYEALDAAIGQVVAHAQPDTTIVLLTHGIGPHYDGVHLLEPLLGRLDTWLDGDVTNGASGAVLITDPEVDAATRMRRRFFRSWNNDVVGGVRLNLAGREAHGVVDPDDAADLLDWLDHQLHTLVDVDQRAPLVACTYRCSERYPEATDSTLPDLFVEWNRDAPIETVWSPTTGVVRHRYDLWRTGDHRQRAMVVAAGNGIVPGPHPTVPAAAVPAGITSLFDAELPGAQTEAPNWWKA